MKIFKWYRDIKEKTLLRNIYQEINANDANLTKKIKELQDRVEHAIDIFCASIRDLRIEICKLKTKKTKTTKKAKK